MSVKIVDGFEPEAVRKVEKLNFRRRNLWKRFEGETLGSNPLINVGLTVS